MSWKPFFGSLGMPRRLVVKVGSSTLSADVDGKPYIDALVDATAVLRSLGHEVIIVTSGAVSCGMQRLGCESCDGGSIDRCTDDCRSDLCGDRGCDG